MTPSELPVALKLLQGRWEGAIRYHSESTRVGFEFVPKKGKLLAREWLPNLHAFGSPVGYVSEKDNLYSIPSLGAEFSIQNSKLSGRLSSADVSVVLDRTTREFPAEPALATSQPAPKTAWSYRAKGPIWSTPAYANGRVVISDASGHLQALKAETGERVWLFDAHAPLYGEPAVSGGAVYVVADSGWLFKLAATSGKLIWKVNLGGGTVRRSLPGSPDGWDCTSPMPIVQDEYIYVGSADGIFHALESSTGREVWNFKSGDKIRGSALCTSDDVFFGSFDHFVYALDRKSGAQRWRFDTGSAVTTTPVLVNGDVLIGTRDKSLLYSLGIADGKPVWQLFHWLSWVESAPRLTDGILYIGSSDRRIVQALDPKDGSVVWNTDVFGWSWGTPLVLDDTVYYATAGSANYISRQIPSIGALDRRTGLPKWRHQVALVPNQFVSGYSNSLIFADGKIVAAGLDGTVVAFTPDSAKPAVAARSQSQE